MSADYAKLYLPSKDAVDRGGEEVILSLGRKKDEGRNLVALSLSDIKKAQENVFNKKGAFIGAEHEFLQFVKKIPLQKHSSATNLSAPFSYSENLDIIIVDDSSSSDDSVSSADDILTKEFPIPVRHITTDVGKESHLKLLGKIVEPPRSLIVSSDIVNRGIIEGNDDLLSKLFESENCALSLEEAGNYIDGNDLSPNTFIRFSNAQTTSPTVAQVTGERIYHGDRLRGFKNLEVKLLSGSKIEKVRSQKYLGIKPRDLEQYLALHEVIMNDHISVAFVSGEQGSGKTLLTYIGAIWQILDFNCSSAKKDIIVGTEIEPVHPSKRHDFKGFKKIVLYKSNDVMGGERRETGYLPGNLFAKMRPFLQSYEDCHNETSLGEHLSFVDMFRHPKYPLEDFPEPRNYKGLIEGGKLPLGNQAIEFRYSGHARGITLSDTLIIIDEAQNFTPYEIKTLSERMGKGSKLVVLGDPLQCDAIGHTSPEINGFTAGIKHYLDKPYSALVKLEQNYRHQASDDARKWKGASN